MMNRRFLVWEHPYTKLAFEQQFPTCGLWTNVATKLLQGVHESIYPSGLLPSQGRMELPPFWNLPTGETSPWSLLSWPAQWNTPKKQLTSSGNGWPISQKHHRRAQATAVILGGGGGRRVLQKKPMLKMHCPTREGCNLLTERLWGPKQNNLHSGLLAQLGVVTNLRNWKMETLRCSERHCDPLKTLLKNTNQNLNFCVWSPSRGRVQ